MSRWSGTAGSLLGRVKHGSRSMKIDVSEPRMSGACTRRRFLAGALKAVASVTLSGWGAGVLAESRRPWISADNVTIIDTHTHFYDPTRPHGVPWPPPEDKLLYRRVLPMNYRALPTPRAVTGTVVVEASP